MPGMSLGASDSSSGESTSESAYESSSEAPTTQEQSNEEPEPVNDSFELDIKRPDRDAEPAHVNFVLPGADRVLALKLKQYRAQMYNIST